MNEASLIEIMIEISLFLGMAITAMLKKVRKMGVE